MIKRIPARLLSAGFVRNRTSSAASMASPPCLKRRRSGSLVQIRRSVGGHLLLRGNPGLLWVNDYDNFTCLRLRRRPFELEGRWP